MRVFHLTLGPIGTNTYLVSCENGVAVIIDPAANHKKIIEVIEEQNLSLKAILLTHAHYDHIGAVAPLCEKYPDLEVYLHAEDNTFVEYYKQGTLPGYINKDDYKNINITSFVTDGDEITFGNLCFIVMHTPGHSRGSVCYRCEDSIFTGDTLFRREVGRTDLEGGNYGTLLASLRRICSLDGDYTVLPGHEGFSTLDEERLENHYIQEAFR